MIWRLGAIAVASLLSLTFSASSVAAPAPTGIETSIERVSVSSDGAQADGRSVAAQVSADGRYVAFVSNASNLVAEEPDYLCEENVEFHGSEICRAIYLRDRETDMTERLPLSGSGGDLDADAYLIAMTPDARFLAFWSTAAILGVEQTPAGPLIGVFLFDRETGTTEWVDLDSDGAPSTQYTSGASLSDDGRFVALRTKDDLVPEDTNNRSDVYIRDRENMTTERVSVGYSGGQSEFGVSGGAISGDGSTIAFAGRETDFVENVPEHYVEGVIIRDTENNTSTVLQLAEDDPRMTSAESLSLSTDGRMVTFIARVWAEDGSTAGQVLQYDRDSQAFTVVSKSSLGIDANHKGGSKFNPSDATATFDGGVVAFGSTATNLVETDANNCRDIFVHDVDTGITRRVNVSTDGTEADHEAKMPAISALGSTVVFESGARNLVSGDTNGESDIFVVDLTGDSQPGEAAGLSPLGIPEAPVYCGPEPGDFDCDGEITPMDALHVLAWIAELDSYGECVGLANPMHCFGGVFAADALAILRYVAGIGGPLGCNAK